MCVNHVYHCAGLGKSAFLRTNFCVLLKRAQMFSLYMYRNFKCNITLTYVDNYSQNHKFIYLVYRDIYITIRLTTKHFTQYITNIIVTQYLSTCKLL